MQLLALAALAPLLAPHASAKTIPARTVFAAEELVVLSQSAQRDCGFANPQQLIGLADDVRKKALRCLVSLTVKESGSLLPKEMERGATIISATESEGFIVFAMQFEPEHPRASVPENATSDYDRLLSNRTCQDKWLGGLIDAGIEGGTQGGTMIVYKIQNKKRENLAIIAVGQCFNQR